MIFYSTTNQRVIIRKAPANRKWMDDTSNGFANRCLPLRMANQHSWEILAPYSFTAMWSGGDSQDSILIIAEGEDSFVTSHFGFGILTFHIGGVIRTPEHFNLYVQGPINSPKDAIFPLCGIVETDWSPMTFTMNWKFTRPDVAIHFEAGEAICSFFPIQRGFLEEIEPKIRNIGENTELFEEHRIWSQSRMQFNQNLKNGSEVSGAWQKHYLKGITPRTTSTISPEHQTSLKLNDFKSDD